MQIKLQIKKAIENVKKKTGGFGIKEIAVALGGIVLVGLIITAINGKLSDWLDDIWVWITNFMNDKIG